MNNNSILLIIVVLMAVALGVVSMRDGKKGRGARGPSQRERPQALAPDAPLGFFGLFNRKKKVEDKNITLKKASSATKSVSDSFSTGETLKKVSDPFSTGKTLKKASDPFDKPVKKASSASKSVSNDFSTSKKVTSNATTAEKKVASNIATIGKRKTCKKCFCKLGGDLDDEQAMGYPLHKVFEKPLAECSCEFCD